MYQSYDKIDLNEEDSFDDLDSHYELMDYASTSGEDLEDAEKEKKKREKKRKEILNDDDDGIVDFYKTDANVKRGAESRELYAQLAKTVREEKGPEVQQAMETACYYMKGLVRKFIASRYITYVERDASFKDDLEHEAYLAIMLALPRYDEEKGDPSTYFYYQIKSAMAHLTTASKHQMTQSDAALKKKIKDIRKRYEELGNEPSLADYAIETGETMSQIRNILRLMSIDNNTHLESIPQFDQLIAGKAEFNNNYETPENLVVRKMQMESIIKRMHELFNEDECDMYIRYAVDGESISSIAREYGFENNDDRIRRIIERVEHGMRYDPIARSYMGIHRGPEVNSIQFIPLEGVRDNLDKLAEIPL